MKRAHHSAGIAVEAVVGLVVADAVHCLPHYLLDVHIGVFRADLTAHNHKSCGAKSLAGNLGFRVLAEKFVKYGV